MLAASTRRYGLPRDLDFAEDGFSESPSAYPDAQVAAVATTLGRALRFGLRPEEMEVDDPVQEIRIHPPASTEKNLHREITFSFDQPEKKSQFEHAVNPVHRGKISTQKIQEMKHAFTAESLERKQQRDQEKAKQEQQQKREGSTIRSLSPSDKASEADEFSPKRPRTSTPKRIRRIPTVILGVAARVLQEQELELECAELNVTETEGSVGPICSSILDPKPSLLSGSSELDSKKTSVTGLAAVRTAALKNPSLAAIPARGSRGGVSFNVFCRLATFRGNRVEVAPLTDATSNKKLSLATHVLPTLMTHCVAQSHRGNIVAMRPKTSIRFTHVAATLEHINGASARRTRELLEILTVLFDPVEGADLDTPIPSVISDLAAKTRLLQWLSKGLVAWSDKERGKGGLRSVIVLLTSGRLGEACAVATQLGCPRLALLLATGPMAAKEALSATALSPAMQSDPDTARLVSLLALRNLPRDAQARALVGLPRAAALVTLLQSAPDSSLVEVFRMYVEVEPLLMPDPSITRDEIPDPRDILCALQLYCEPKEPEHLISLISSAVLNPSSLIPDYTCAFLIVLAKVLVPLSQGASVSPMVGRAAVHVLAKYAACLEALGQWHFAVFILQLMPTERANAKSNESWCVLPAQLDAFIAEVIARNAAPTSEPSNEQEKTILNQLHISRSLLSRAKVMRIKSLVRSTKNMSVDNPGKTERPPTAFLGVITRPTKSRIHWLRELFDTAKLDSRLFHECASALSELTPPLVLAQYTQEIAERVQILEEVGGNEGMARVPMIAQAARAFSMLLTSRPPAPATRPKRGTTWPSAAQLPEDVQEVIDIVAKARQHATTIHERYAVFNSLVFFLLYLVTLFALFEWSSHLKPLIIDTNLLERLCDALMTT
jgi:hypothetical protein